MCTKSIVTSVFSVFRFAIISGNRDAPTGGSEYSAGWEAVIRMQWFCLCHSVTDTLNAGLFQRIAVVSADRFSVVGPKGLW